MMDPCVSSVSKALVARGSREFAEIQNANTVRVRNCIPDELTATTLAVVVVMCDLERPIITRVIG